MHKLILSFATLIAFTSAGCKAKDTEAGTAAVAQMKVFKETLCNCKDAECMVKTGTDIEAFGTKLEKSNDKASDGQMKEIEAIGKEIQGCTEKLTKTLTAEKKPDEAKPADDKPAEPPAAGSN